MEGWIKLHRKLQKWEWYQDSHMVHLFIHLLFDANYEDKKWKGIEVKRGQVITGLKSLHLNTGISIQSLRTCLLRLEDTGEINRQTNNQHSIITISNYDSYQLLEVTGNKQNNNPVTSDQQTGNNPVTPTKKEKKDKEFKESKEEVPTLSDFLNYAKEKKPDVNIEAVRLKYESWVENGWKDGNDKPIKNWKSKLLNTIPHLKEVDGRQVHDRTKKQDMKWLDVPIPEGTPMPDSIKKLASRIGKE